MQDYINSKFKNYCDKFIYIHIPTPSETIVKSSLDIISQLGKIIKD